jgi:hypothetical protein
VGVCAFIAANENAAQRANLKSIITVQAFSLKINLSGSPVSVWEATNKRH